MIKLPAELSIQHLEELRSTLDTSLHQSAISLFGNAFTKADTSGLLLIAAFTKTCGNSNIDVQGQEPSAPLQTAANALGMAQLLKL